MMHERRWALAEVETIDLLAKMLTESTWKLCSAFFVQGHDAYLFLNDATSEDGAGEYACLKKLADGSYLQVESITFSWCDLATARAYIEEALAGKFDLVDFARPVSSQIDLPGQHERCHLCA